MAKRKIKKAAATKFTTEQIQHELARRRTFPAWTEEIGVTIPQVVTVAFLEKELAAMPSDDPDREWREWELALAREHYRLWPGLAFVRQVEPTQLRLAFDADRASQQGGQPLTMN